MTEVAQAPTKEELPETVLLEKFLSHLEFERRLSPYTLRYYRQALEVFFNWLRKTVSWAGDLDAITRREARDFLIERQRAVSRRTLRNQVSGIRAFFKYCLRQGHAKANPFLSISLPKLPKTLPKFLTQSQMETLLAQPDRLLEGEGADPFAALRGRMILELLYGGGLRVSELIGLDYGALDLQRGVVRVLGKGRKERLCPIGPQAAQAARRFRDECAKDASLDSPVVVNRSGKRLSTRSVQLLTKKYLRMAGLPLDLSPHKLRHAFATLGLLAGINPKVVSEALGHSSVTITLDLYSHVLPNMQAELAGAVANLLKREPQVD